MHSALHDIPSTTNLHHFCSAWTNFLQNSIEVHWSFIECKWFLAHDTRWRLSLVVQSGTLAGHLWCRPAWCKWFQMVWCISWLPLDFLNVPANMWFGQMMSSSMLFCDSFSLSVSQLQSADEALWHWAQWTLPSEKILFRALQWWSTVDKLLGVILVLWG